MFLKGLSTRRSLSFAACLVATSCGTEQIGQPDVLSAISWEATEVIGFESLTSPKALVEVAAGTVLVRGQAFEPCHGWDPVATGSRTGDTLVLGIDWLDTEICADMPTGFLYEATLSPLEAGQYHVRVRQRVLVREPWSYPFSTVLDTIVRVLE